VQPSPASLNALLSSGPLTKTCHNQQQRDRLFGGVPKPQNWIEELERKLPFTLTNAQKRVILEILNDMQKSKPMNRLLQGDVGSGKTVVAMFAMFVAAKNGKQSAVMVPTEVLAFQHYMVFSQWAEQFGLRVGLLVGSLSASEKE